MRNHSKIRKYLRIRWDIAFRRKFVVASPDEQISELMAQCRHIAAESQRHREIQELMESINPPQTWTST